MDSRVVSGAGVLLAKGSTQALGLQRWSEKGPWCSVGEDLLPSAGCRGQQTAPFTVNLNFFLYPSAGVHP